MVKRQKIYPEVISAAISEELDIRLREECEKTSLSVSEIVRAALRKHLNLPERSAHIVRATKKQLLELKNLGYDVKLS